MVGIIMIAMISIALEYKSTYLHRYTPYFRTLSDRVMELYVSSHCYKIPKSFLVHIFDTFQMW